MHWYVRTPRLVAIARKTSYLFVVSDRPAPVLLDPIDVEMMATVLARTAIPIRHAELAADCDDEALALLVDLGVLERLGDAEAASHATPFRPAVADKRCRNIVIGL